MTPKVSVIGSGKWGKKLIYKFHNLGGVHLVYGHQNRDLLAPQGIYFTEDINNLIKTSNAVVVATPPPTHVELAKMVLEAGKDLLLEKPMALILNEATALAKLADNNQCLLMVGHTLCYSKAMNMLKSLPGVIDSAEAVYLKTSTTEKLLNGYWNLAIHLLALAVVLEVPEDKFELIADDTAEKNQRTFTLTKLVGCSRSSVTFDFLGPSNPPDDMLATECQHFLDCLITRQTPLTDGRHGAEVIRRLEKISPHYQKIIY